MSDLTLFICETFSEEITRIAAEFTDIAIIVRLIPHHCTLGPQKLEHIRRILSEQHDEGHSGIYFGDAQIQRQGILPPGITHAGPATCNALIAPSEWLNSFISEGAFIISPGWIRSWERYVTEMGFDPGTPTTFYSSNLKEIVILDTGVVSVTQERISSFEDFSGLPVRIIPFGLSYFSCIVRDAVNQWQISRIKSSSTREVALATESSARQMAVITLLSDIARVSDEKEVISRIIMTCQALFAPHMTCYLPVSGDRHGPVISVPPAQDPGTKEQFLLTATGKEYIFNPDESGYAVPVMYQQETVGMLGVFDVSVPERIREYLNMTLSFTRFLGLAIKNARSWSEIRETKDQLEDLNTELIDKNEELIAISQELQSANQELITSKQILTESEQFIKAIVSFAQVGIAVLDPDFSILFWNPEMERMFGLLYPDIRGKNFIEVFPIIVKVNRDKFLLQALHGEVVRAPDFEYPTGPDSKPFWISSIYSPVYDLAGKIIGVIINVYDITLRKRTEQDLEGAYGAIRKAQEKLSILSSITRHDILNRVMVITSYSELLSEVITDEKSLRQLKSMEIAGKDIQHLIEFTREYQELGVKKPVWMSIGDVMNRRTVQSVLTGISLSIGGIDAEIFVDPMLEKVMYNLVENSKRHGERVSAITLFSEQIGEDLVIAYTDNGVGVAPEEKELIFKQGHGKNTGMGLFLIREILSLTNIAIRECGVPGEGVRFEITVPKGEWRIKSTDNIENQD